MRSGGGGGGWMGGRGTIHDEWTNKKEKGRRRPHHEIRKWDEWFDEGSDTRQTGNDSEDSVMKRPGSSTIDPIAGE